MIIMSIVRRQVVYYNTDVYVAVQIATGAFRR
jgi:hypothetical protein